MNDVIVAIHGILTRTTAPSWPDQLDAYLRGYKVEKKDYFAWPLPALNVWIKNRIIARGLAAELELLPADLPLHFVAHSNGCDIALKVIARLINRGRRIQTVILTGSVTSADVDDTAIAVNVLYGKIGKAFAYFSTDDKPLLLSKWRVGYPYGTLGLTGWMQHGKPYETLRIRSRNYPGGHSGYFSDENREKVFAQMREDMGLS